jgi:hypothetical protein
MTVTVTATLLHLVPSLPTSDMFHSASLLIFSAVAGTRLTALCPRITLLSEREQLSTLSRALQTRYGLCVTALLSFSLSFFLSLSLPPSLLFPSLSPLSSLVPLSPIISRITLFLSRAVLRLSCVLRSAHPREGL